MPTKQEVKKSFFIYLLTAYLHTIEIKFFERWWQGTIGLNLGFGSLHKLLRCPSNVNLIKREES